jgi:UrcA family protein
MNMIKTLNLKTLGCVGLAAAASLALCAVPASAQDYRYGGGYAADNGYDGGQDMSGVTVYAPRHFGYSSSTGAPIEMVSSSRVVDFSDLDPYTPHGSYVLHRRIISAARAACDEIDAHFGDTTDDQPPCVRTAVRNAMYDLDDQLGR